MAGAYPTGACRTACEIKQVSRSTGRASVARSSNATHVEVGCCFPEKRSASPTPATTRSCSAFAASRSRDGRPAFQRAARLGPRARRDCLWVRAGICRGTDARRCLCLAPDTAARPKQERCRRGRSRRAEAAPDPRPPTSRALDPPPYGHLGAVASSRGMRGRRVFGPETQCGAWTQSMVERVAVGRPQAGLQRCDMGCRERRAHREGRTILIDVGTAWRHEKWLQPLQPAAGILGACP